MCIRQPSSPESTFIFTRIPTLSRNGLLGSCGKIVGKSGIILIGHIAGKFKTVGDFVSVKTSKNHKVQQLSTSDVQQVQYQSIKNNKIPQTSTGF